MTQAVSLNEAANRRARSGALAEQFIQFAFAVQGSQVIVTAHMTVADEDLRHRATTAASLQHGLAVLGILIDLDFADSDALAFKEAARALTIAAPSGRVHDDIGCVVHDYFLGAPFTTGKFSCSQLCSPPRNETTFVKPRSRKVFAADPAEVPLSQ